VGPKAFAFSRMRDTGAPSFDSTVDARMLLYRTGPHRPFRSHSETRPILFPKAFFSPKTSRWLYDLCGPVATVSIFPKRARPPVGSSPLFLRHLTTQVGVPARDERRGAVHRGVGQPSFDELTPGARRTVRWREAILPRWRSSTGPPMDRSSNFLTGVSHRFLPDLSWTRPIRM